MFVLQLRVGTMANFVYLLVDEESREGLVVDSGWETGPLIKAAAEKGARIKYAVATHEHFDHVSTLDELAKRLGAEVVAHESSPVRADVRVVDGSELALGRSVIRVLHTPGHTDDSICLYDGAEVFTGDTLFVGTIGRFEASEARKMHRSLYDVILKLPGETEMYPGHDYGDVPHRALREEERSNPYLGARDLRSFLSLFS
ncbi:MAG TPA: MBL fold metallo-hydrolase [Nitrososphaerales archaeon]|nr:MBL fold metallo-hydrolase [Nitrososphaerales archaeon]